MRVGSLFSGIGGIELGLERAGGFKTVWFVENDLHAQAVLRKHWPGAEIFSDITTVDFTSVQRIDVLTGGFPCQDISTAGKRAGITGSRSSLWKHYLRAISEIRPRIALIENVSALTRRGLDVVLCDLASIGYDAEWYCLPASSVGAPHRRDRIFILAYTNSGGCVHGQITEQSNQGWESALSNTREESIDVADTDEWRFKTGNESKYSTLRERTVRENKSNDRSEVWSESWKCRNENGANVSDSDSWRLERTSSKGRDERDAQWLCDNGWWAVEPDVGRVAYGVPLRVDRIKRLGNAVVPAVAQAIGEAINECEVRR